ncbi:hypothetical protein GUJ93_ZPchr0004g39612 [Zizania palustris]|uniref:Uncharacterized protein n=1 Tax=Zizania palustris TaxID=103762 RepID=A0A8J5SQB4_ZIZPA|nr:hypothetical protein GUJ93_ZPchr0004g39612 [Zizania palustris]
MAFGDSWGSSRWKASRTPDRSSEDGNLSPALKNASKTTTSPSRGSGTVSWPDFLASAPGPRRPRVASSMDRAEHADGPSSRVYSQNLSDAARSSHGSRVFDGPGAITAAVAAATWHCRNRGSTVAAGVPLSAMTEGGDEEAGCSGDEGES